MYWLKISLRATLQRITPKITMKLATAASSETNVHVPQTLFKKSGSALACIQSQRDALLGNVDCSRSWSNPSNARAAITRRVLCAWHAAFQVARETTNVRVLVLCRTQAYRSRRFRWRPGLPWIGWLASP